jgi:hypothetical protein
MGGSGYQRMSRCAGAGILAISMVCAAGVLVAGPASATAVTAHRCSGTSFTWTGNDDGTSWSDAKNWDPSGDPGSCSADSVDIPIEANITGVPAVTLQNFTTDSSAGSDGSLVGGPLTVTGHFEWDGSSLGATVNIPAGATGTIAGPANVKGVGSSDLGVPGTINVSGSLALDNTSGSGGSINLSGDVSQGIIAVMPGGTLTAAGTNNLFDSCCGAGVPALENNGTIDVTSGRLFTQGVDLDQAGHLSVAAGALLDADAPTTLENSSTYAGSGELLLDVSAVPTTLGGTISLGEGFHLNLGPQACMDGTGTITGKGSFDYTGGNLAATLTIAPGALMHVTGANGKDLRAFSCGTHDGRITNNGKILVDHKGALSLGGAGTITTSKGATFAIAPGATVTTDSCCGTKKLLFTNGTLQVTAPPSGVASGTPATLDFAPLANTGTISVASGQKLLITGAPASFGTGTTVTGAGGTTVIQAPTTASGTLTLGSSATLDLGQNGSVDGIVNLAGTGALHWTGGTLSGTVSVPSTIPVSISGAVNHEVTSRPNGMVSTLTTNGPVTVAAGTTKAADSINVDIGDQWINAGTLTLPKHASLGAFTCCGPTPGLKNTGTVTVATGGGEDSVTTPVLNDGTINLASGIVAQTAGSFQQGTSGTFGVTFAGTSPGTGFGQWASTGAVQLAGRLLIGTSGGFKPPKSKPFAVLRYTSRSGKFGTLSGSPAYTVGYHATSMDVAFR